MRLNLLKLVLLFALCYLAQSAIPALKISDADIKDIAQKMRDSDTEKPNFCEFYIDYQGHYDGGESDYASQSLTKWIRPQVLQQPSYKALLDLVPYFNPQTGVAEDASPAKVTKQRAFIMAVFNSGPFKQLIDVLRKSNHPFAKSPDTLKQAMYDMWFGTFSRARGKQDSSAFEHVFLGEAKNGEVSGMHNWVVINQLENDEKNKLNYRGFIIKRADIIASANFKWGNLVKPTGSFLMGTSPAFDFSLLSMCFLARRGKGTKCETVIDGCPVNVQSYDLSQNGKDFIGTVYPEPGPSAPTFVLAKFTVVVIVIVTLSLFYSHDRRIFKNSISRRYDSKRDYFVDDFPCYQLVGDSVNKTFLQYAKSWKPNKNKFIDSVYPTNDSIDCSQLKDMYDFNDAPLSSEEAEYPLAYGFHIYKDISQVLAVLSTFYHPQNAYCIGVDSRSTALFQNRVKLLEKCLGNVTVKIFENVRWCSKGTLNALYGCFSYLTSLDHPWRYYQYISNNDLPLKTNFEMVQIFKNLKGAVITELVRPQKAETKFTVIPVYKASMSAIVSREAANYVVVNCTITQFILHLLRKKPLYACPDELLWATLFGNKDVFSAPGSFDYTSMRYVYVKQIKENRNKRLIVNATSSKAEPFMLSYYYIPRYQVWSGSPRKCNGKFVHASCVFGVRDLPMLIKRPELVAHKLYSDFQPAAFYCLRKMVKERALQYEQMLFKGTVYSELAHVQVLMGQNPENVKFFYCFSY
ncbi:unnamed protein product [Bursaphelenchus okinawaensis]|uniref:EndoU domain-containing protein n=1 Tax=Bursaphelenchus okinawaensis TaxID=465554 RepID=A0A811LLK7_9BILA|nr:unnamed protein product [Bursaphelenchus okinawaensis]CAG9126479.1 unnamed protein product [Bursaphelenchus okinawaensis]